MKWNTNNIIEFLNVYQQYPILWNIKDKEYSNVNTKLKDEMYENLLIKLNEKQLTLGMDVKQLEAKIKSIKDVYRQEIHKVEKSKKSGCGSEEVYTPKLAWFKNAHFLTESVATRRSNSNHIHEEALCPDGACVDCVSTAVAANEFRIFVRNSQAIWTKSVASLQTTPRQEGTMKALGIIFKRDTLTIHTVKDYIGDKPLQIINRLKERVKKKPPKKRRITKNGSFVCGDCEKAFTSPVLLAQHLNCSAQKDACLTCGQVLFRGKDMKEHLTTVHNQKVYHCNDCTSLFKNLEELDEHMKIAHVKGALTCGDCGRTFKRSGTLEAHTQMHAVRTCRSCGKQFTNRGCYREHRSQCEPEARPDVKSMSKDRRCNVRDPASFTCDYCGKTYNSRPQLKNHIIWIHMNIRPYECQWCRKRFYTPGRLAEHSVVHTRVRNFACDICGMKLVSKMAVVYHRRRHTGEKPYACEDCGERFISASRRSEHAKRKHKKGNLVQCLQCPDSFARGTDLRKHMEKVHSRRPAVLRTELKIEGVST